MNLERLPLLVQGEGVILALVEDGLREPGLVSAPNSRIGTADLACQLENSRPARVRQSQDFATEARGVEVACVACAAGGRACSAPSLPHLRWWLARQPRWQVSSTLWVDWQSSAISFK